MGGSIANDFPYRFKNNDGKDEHTNKRGKRHRITIYPSDYPEELWIALYAQTMLVEQ